MNFKVVFMPGFNRIIRQLKKRYRQVTEDVKVAIEAIEQNVDVGVVIPNDYNIRKLRVASRDMQRGKSGGFRLLYLLKVSEETIIVYLLWLYAKVDQQDVKMETLEELTITIDEHLSDDENS